MSSQAQQEIESDRVYCAIHKNVETALLCGRCGTPICPGCLVSTPVGARCRNCAQVRRLPTFQLSPLILTRGVVAGLVAGALGGVVWGLLSVIIFLGFFAFFIAMGIGYVIGEAVSWATNRKRGPQLVGIVVAAVILAFVVRNFITFQLPLVGNDLWGMIAVVLAAMVAIGRVRT